MKRRKRRAIVLVEMLTVIAIMVFAGGLATMVFESLMKANTRTARFADRYAQLQDFLRTLEQDVRQASVIESPNETGSGAQPRRPLSRFTLVGPSSRIVYTLDAGGVTRTPEASPDAARHWDSSLGSLSVNVRRDATGRQTVLAASVTWRRADPAEYQPRRDFELTARCVSQETDHD